MGGHQKWPTLFEIVTDRLNEFYFPKVDPSFRWISTGSPLSLFMFYILIFFPCAENGLSPQKWNTFSWSSLGSEFVSLYVLYLPLFFSILKSQPVKAFIDLSLFYPQEERPFRRSLLGPLWFCLVFIPWFFFSPERYGTLSFAVGTLLSGLLLSRFKSFSVLYFPLRTFFWISK